MDTLLAGRVAESDTTQAAAKRRPRILKALLALALVSALLGLNSHSAGAVTRAAGARLDCTYDWVSVPTYSTTYIGNPGIVAQPKIWVWYPGATQWTFFRAEGITTIEAHSGTGTHMVWATLSSFTQVTGYSLKSLPRGTYYSVEYSMKANKDDNRWTYAWATYSGSGGGTQCIR